MILLANESEEGEKPVPSIEQPLGFYWTEGRSGVGITVDGIPPLKSGSAVGIPSAPAVLFPDGEVLMPSISALERLQGFQVGWTDAAARPRRDPRWRLLGNAVSVPAAQWVASKIKTPSEALDFETRLLEPGTPWPNAAFNVGTGRYIVRASTKPLAETAPSINCFRDNTWIVLSSRALGGFIKRARESNLRFPRGFVEALEANLQRRPATESKPGKSS